MEGADVTHRAGLLMAKEFLEALEPPLSSVSRKALLDALEESGQGLSALSRLDQQALADLGIASPLERASLLAAAASHSVMAPPPRTTPPGPVVVEVKLGFLELSNIDTIQQTFRARFFLDLFWNDPRLIGARSVPDGTWFPKGIYIRNGFGEMSVEAYEKPIMVDSDKGRVLWAQDIQGDVSNPMSLSDFPFDTDALEIVVHMAEDASRDVYVLRPFGGGWNGYRTLPDAETSAREGKSVNFFFDVFQEVDEWEMTGFSIEAYEVVGGNAVEYSEYHCFLHVTRRWQYYAWKIVLPLCICTLFCMSAFLFEADDLSNRNGTSVTMFLATSALLYVVASLLPKTSYLTAIDKFVIQTLLVQFLIGVWSWTADSLLKYAPPGTLTREDDLLVLAILGFFYLACVVLFFVAPLRKGVCGLKLGGGCRSKRMSRVKPPASKLLEDAPMTRFHKLERFVNVWPRKPAGEAPSNYLKPHWNEAISA